MDFELKRDFNDIYYMLECYPDDEAYQTVLDLKSGKKEAILLFARAFLRLFLGFVLFCFQPFHLL